MGRRKSSLSKRLELKVNKHRERRDHRCSFFPVKILLFTTLHRDDQRLRLGQPPLSNGVRTNLKKFPSEIQKKLSLQLVEFQLCDIL